MSAKASHKNPSAGPVLLADIGNTHTHLGLAHGDRIVRLTHVPTGAWLRREGKTLLADYCRGITPEMVACCSVVPPATPWLEKAVSDLWGRETFELTERTVTEIGIDYPHPKSIGPDRLANAIAVCHFYGAPALAVDFGTAVTFDIVNAKGDYVGGIITPGLSAMTSYLHEKTALLPAIEIREIPTCIGKNTQDAMTIGAVHGYRGMIRTLIAELKKELRAPRLPVVATGGYAELIAAKITEIGCVEQKLTLMGLLLAVRNQTPPASQSRRKR
jgi:type III pantothenate kinase